MSLIDARGHSMEIHGGARTVVYGGGYLGSYVLTRLYCTNEPSHDAYLLRVRAYLSLAASFNRHRPCVLYSLSRTLV